MSCSARLVLLHSEAIKVLDSFHDYTADYTISRGPTIFIGGLLRNGLISGAIGAP